MSKKMFSGKSVYEKASAAALWVVLTALLYYCHTKVNISSDSTTMLPVAKNFLDGNILLKDWVLGTNNFFFTETIWYALFIALGFSYNFMLDFIPAAVIAALTVMCMWFFIYKSDDIKEKNGIYTIIFSMLAFIMIGVVPFQTAYTLVNPNSHNNLYIFDVICILLVLDYMKKPALRTIIIYDVIALLMAFSESVTSMVLFAPVGLYCVYTFIFKKADRRGAVIVLANSVSMFLLSKLWAKVLAAVGGLYTRGMPIYRASLRFYGERIHGFYKQMEILFGIHHVDGIVVTPETLINNVLLWLLIAGFAVTLIYCLIRFNRLSETDKLLFLIVAVNLFLSVVTNVVIYYRYVVPAFVFGTVLYARIMIENADRIRHIKRLAAFAAVLSGFLIFVRVKQIILQPVFGGEQRVVMNEITDRGWGDGYGDFWCSSMLSYYSEFKSDIYPVYIEDGKMYGYEELIQKSWFDEKNKHFIMTFANGGSAFIDNNELFEVLGEPDDSFSYGSYEAFYYEKDISDYINFKE